MRYALGSTARSGVLQARRAMLIAVLVGALSALLFALVPRAEASPPLSRLSAFGVWEPRTVYDPNLDREFHDLAWFLGARHHRWALRWENVEFSPPVSPRVHSYNWGGAPTVYNNDLRYGTRSLIVLHAAPWWSWSVTGCPNCSGEMPPASTRLVDWGDFVYQAARQFPHADFEIWNEPNLKDYWGCIHNGATGVCETVLYPDASYYTTLLAKAREALDAARRDMNYLGISHSVGIVGGALATAADQGGNQSVRTFASTMIARGALQSMDAFSVHLYPTRNPQQAPYDHTVLQGSYCQLVGTASGECGSNGALNTVPHSLPNPPIWITEYGASRTGSQFVSQAQQASILADTQRWLDAKGNVGAYFVGPVYSARNQGNPAEQPDSNPADEGRDLGLSLSEWNTPFSASWRPTEPFGITPVLAFSKVRETVGQEDKNPLNFQASAGGFQGNAIRVNTYCGELCVVRSNGGWIRSTSGNWYAVLGDNVYAWGAAAEVLSYLGWGLQGRTMLFKWAGPGLTASQVQSYCINLSAFGPGGKTASWVSSPGAC
jgi:Glycosyl hydrolase catalytic core